MTSESKPDKPRILLAEDHDLVAAGICQLLETRYQVLGQVKEGKALLVAAELHRPDLILTDLSMPGLDGLEATRRLSARLPAIPVIVLTMHEDACHARAAFEAGAVGYLVKSSAPRELFDAIDEVLAGRRYLTPIVAGRVMATLLPGQANSDVARLSRRETEVAGLIGEGLENSEIAARLCIAPVTVRTHHQRILRKLQLRNRVELARYALVRGLTTLVAPEKSMRP